PAPATAAAVAPPATAAAVAAAATRAILARAGFVNGERPAGDLLAVHGGDRRVHLVVRDFDEAEALRAPRVAVGRNCCAAAAPLRECLFQVGFRHFPGEIADEKSLAHTVSIESFCGARPRSIAVRFPLRRW